MRLKKSFRSLHRSHQAVAVMCQVNCLHKTTDFPAMIFFYVNIQVTFVISVHYKIYIYWNIHFTTSRVSNITRCHFLHHRHTADVSTLHTIFYQFYPHNLSCFQLCLAHHNHNWSVQCEIMSLILLVYVFYLWHF